MSKTTRAVLCVCAALYVGLVVWTIIERNVVVAIYHRKDACDKFEKENVNNDA